MTVRPAHTISWVITAAHCGEGQFVEIGRHSLTADDKCVERIKVKRTIIHQNYSNTDQTNDFALLELKEASKYDPIDLFLKQVPEDLVIIITLITRVTRITLIPLMTLITLIGESGQQITDCGMGNTVRSRFNARPTAAGARASRGSGTTLSTPYAPSWGTLHSHTPYEPTH